MTDVTKILQKIEQGDDAASEQLLPLVYDELRKLAAARLANEKPGQTLQATALVHEAYLRLVNVSDDQRWNSRGHFFAAAAEAMRRLVIERARRKQTEKHGGKFQRISLDDCDLADRSRDHELLILNDALERFEELDRIKAELVKLRFFAGLSVAQAAAALGIGVSTAEKYWTFSRCWLRSEMERLRES
jgi:RNA polymerase sigma factor (TIGR02999 family)